MPLRRRFTPRMPLTSRKPLITLLAAIAVIVVACGGGSGVALPSPTPEVIAPETSSAASAGESPIQSQSGADAPARLQLRLEITGIDNWLNGEPTTIAEETALNNVVLIDFWTYTCINCLRTIPRLRVWQEKYGDRGLKIIGIHSPEFEFEKRTENVRAEMERLGVTWLVAQDNEMETWRAFDNHVWPAKYLFGVSGLPIYQHFGEGDYAVTETRIRQALISAGHDISDIPFEKLPEDIRDPFAITETPEIYAGYGRSYDQFGQFNGHPDYYTGPDQVLEYGDPGDGFRLDGRYYLQGLWENRIESIVHARETENLEDYITLTFIARSVNVVIKPAFPEASQNPLSDVLPETFEVVIELNDQPLTPEQAGTDIVFNDRGQSVILVQEPRLYALLELPVYSRANLKMRSNSKNFAVTAWTFGTYIEGA